MKVVRHGKPSRAYTSTLRDPRQSDYTALVNAAIEAIIAGEDDIYIAFAYVLKFPADFPKGILVEKLDDKNIRKIKARKLLKWLNDRGHTGFTTEDIRGAVIASGLTMMRMNDMLMMDDPPLVYT